MSDGDHNNVITTNNKSNNGVKHFSILRKSSSTVAPLISQERVIDLGSLDHALHPFANNATTENRSQNESRATTPSYGRREPNEISFLSSLDKVKISHGVKEECLTCCQTLEFRNPENDVVMKATRKRGCSHQNYEIFHVITRELVILIEIDDGTWSCTVPNNIQIYGPPGRLLGSVNRYSACGSNSFFEVRNAVGDSIYTVEPKFQGCFGTSFGPTEYPIVCNDESNLKVAQVISFGCFCGSNLTVNFIEDLIPSKRALVIGFAMMVDLQHQIQVF